MYTHGCWSIGATLQAGVDGSEGNAGGGRAAGAMPAVLAVTSAAAATPD